MSSADNNLYEFENYRLDAAERTLRREDDLVPLPPKVLDVLFLLVEKRGAVVSKKELMDAVWADAFVEESNLTQNIYTLRRVLGKNGSGQDYIETVPRRGYRFAVQVKMLEANEVTVWNGKQTTQNFLPESGHFFDQTSADLSSGFPNNDSDSIFSDTITISSSNEAPPAQTVVSVENKKSSRSIWQAAAFLSLGILVLFAVGFALYQFEKTETKIAPIEMLRFQHLTDTGDVIYPTVSPSGEFLAYVRLEEEQAGIWVKQIATDNSVRILPKSPKGYRSLAFSPDGKHLFFREEADPGAIYQTSILGGEPRKVADNVWSDFSVSPDGKQFAFIRRDTKRNAYLLILENVDGSGSRELNVRTAPHSYSASAPAWSPDGTKLVAVGSSLSEARPILLTVDLKTSQDNELKTPRWREISRTLWTPDGENLIVAARAVDEAVSQVWTVGFPSGETRRLTNDLESYFWLSLSADGRMLVARRQKITAHIWTLPEGDMKKAKQLTFGERNLDGFVGLAWSPDGEIVYGSRTGHITDLYSVGADESERVRLTANFGRDNTNPKVSSDGRYIVFTSNRTEGRQIWRMDADGRNQKQLTPGEGPKETAHSAAISPSGSEVFFIKRASAPSSIWKVSLEGGDAVPVSHLVDAAAEDFLSISPDGKWLAYRHVSAKRTAANNEEILTIGVLPTDGGLEPKLFNLPFRRAAVQWTADSAAIDYCGAAFNSAALWRQPLNGGEPQKLFDFPDRVFHFAWSADGKNLAVSRGRQLGDAVLITNLP